MKSKLGGVLLFASMLCMSLWAEDEEFLPSSKQLEYLKSASDCSVYLAVRKHTRTRYRELLIAKEKIKEIAKQRREALGLCGAPTEDSRRALQDERLATQCPREFAQWIKISEKFLSNGFEIKEAYRNLQSLAGIINYYCGEIPDVLEKLPEEEKTEPGEKQENAPVIISAPPILEAAPVPNIYPLDEEVPRSVWREPSLPDLFIEESMPAENPA